MRDAGIGHGTVREVELIELREVGEKGELGVRDPCMAK